MRISTAAVQTLSAATLALAAAGAVCRRGFP